MSKQAIEVIVILKSDDGLETIGPTFVEQADIQILRDTLEEIEL